MNTFFPPHSRLPQRHPTHQLEERSRDRFRSLFRDPLFLVRDERSPDYGADASIEALVSNGKHATNIRSMVQLKATEKTASTNGKHRVNIKINNIHYMINSHSSFYCLYCAQTDELFYRSSMDIFGELQKYKKIPDHKKFLRVEFTELLTQDRVAKIHEEMVSFADAVKNLEHFYQNDELREVLFDKGEPVPPQGPVIYVYRTDEYGNMIRVEHELWLSYGDLPRGHEVFHRNGMTLDNRRNNLALRPIDPKKYFVEKFYNSEENAAARNIFRVILSGDKAEIENTTSPEPIIFWKVIRILQDQGMSMMQSDVQTYKQDCTRLLGLDF